MKKAYMIPSMSVIRIVPERVILNISFDDNGDNPSVNFGGGGELGSEDGGMIRPWQGNMNRSEW